MRSVLFWPGLAGLLLLCGVQVVVLRGDALQADAIGYGCYGVALLWCAAAAWPNVRREQGKSRVRWMLLFAGFLMAASCYTVACVQNLHWLTDRIGLPNTLALTHISEAMFLLSATMFFSGASRSITVLDTIQALLFAMLRFRLAFAADTADHLAGNNLLISQLVALFLFATAMLALLGAASRGERRFLRLLSLFLGMRLAGFFMADQVSYIWLHYLFASVWDVPATLLYGGFALILVEEFRQPQAANVALPRPSLTARTLMPSLLALVNLVLGLCMLTRYFYLAVTAILAALGFYIARTVRLQVETANDRAQLESRNEQLETLATRDSLTGVGNRRSLSAAYGRLMRAPGAAGCALLLVDIDYFKETNDRFGHLCGDGVLVAVAAVLKQASARVAESHCARFGGDEFALLLPGVTSAEAYRLAEEIRVKIATLTPQPEGVAVSASLGGAGAVSSAMPPLEALVSQADKALYRAKLRGRNRVGWDGDSYAGELAAAGPVMMRRMV